MPSSYTTSLRLVLPATGENSGIWGTLVNSSLTQMVEEAVAGYRSVAMTDADYTLTTVNGATDESRNMFVEMTGTLTQARNVICPTAEKLYFFKNSTTGGYAVTLKTSGGTGVSVPNGKVAVLMCNGTNVIDATSYMSSVTLGTALAAASGGTGNSSYTAGDVLYASGTTALSKLGIGTNNYVLTSSGSAPQWTANTGTGSVVRATSPTIASPTLTGTVAGTPTFDGATITITNALAIGSGTVGGVSIGTLTIPQNAKTADYTLVLGDSGEQIKHSGSDATPRTFTIPANASVAFPIGTAVTFVNQNGAGTLTIAITSDTLRLAGTTTTGSRTLIANGMATALKIDTTEWLISGAGLS